MEIRSRLVGEDPRRATRVLIAVAVLAVCLRLWESTHSYGRLWPPDLLYGVPYAAFFPLFVLFGVAIRLAYRNDGWLIAVSVLYFEMWAALPGPSVRYPEPLVRRMIAELVGLLPFALAYGTACYLLGRGLRHLASRVRRDGRRSPE